MTDTDVNVYKAVVLADSFNDNFIPLAEKTPTVLMPVANVPAIEYTLNFLNASGIQLVYLFCSRYSDKISEYIKSSQWTTTEKRMHIIVVVSKTCLSVGDALRELDSRGIVRNDFVLLSGETVGNVNLKTIIDDHRDRYKKDKRLVMTMLFNRTSPRNRSRSAAEESAIVVDETSGRILHHQNMRSCRKLSVPLSLFTETKTVSIRYDLLDCQVAVCSPQVLHLFSDNFDFQTKDDFIKGILVEEEVLGNILTMHEIDGEYAATISNFHMYDAVSKDIINRWTYPFVPDINFASAFNIFNQVYSPYSYLRQNVYLQKDVTLARSCVLKENVVVGAGTKIGDDSIVVNSVIGNNCIIGNHVTVENAYLWDNVEVQDGCTVISSLLAFGVKLKKNVKVSVGCVLSNNVVVGPSVTLPQGTRLTDEVWADDDEFSLGQTKRPKSGLVDTKLVGSEGKGFVFYGGEQENKDLVNHMLGLHVHSDDEDFSESEAYETGQDSDEEPHMIDDSKLFYKEVLDSLTRAVTEKVSWENLVLEINSSKYAYNVTMREVNTLVTTAVVSLPLTMSKQELDAQEHFRVLKPILTQFVSLLKNYMKSVESQIDCLNSLEEQWNSCSNFAPNLMKVLNLLYDLEVLSEEAILQWYKLTAPKENGDNHVAVRKQINRFIVWLQEAEEESEDDSED